MQKQSSARDYFRLSFSFLTENFGKLWWAFALPLLGAGAVCGSLGWGALLFFQWVDGWIGAKEGFWWGLLSWSIGVFGILLALTFVYLLFVPLLRALLTPLLGIYAERVYELRRGEPFDQTPMFHPRFWKSLSASVVGGLVLAVSQLPLKIGAALVLLFVPGGPLLSIGVEFGVNRRFAALDNFGLLLMAGPRPIVRTKRLERAIKTLGPVVNGYRTIAALLLCVPVLNIFFILVNVTAAALILADRGGPELQDVE